MNLPLEIINQIFHKVEFKQNKIDPLTVCKRWYQPALEAYYTNITFYSMSSIQCFLKTILSHDQKPGKYVRTIDIRSSDIYNKELLTASEFEILARSCPNLNEILFDDSHYWGCLGHLDFSRYWKQLHSIPFVRNKVDYKDVCYELKDRLTNLNVCCFINFGDILNLLAYMSKLKTVCLIDDMNLTLNEVLLEELHRSAPNLEHLKFEIAICSLNSINGTPLKIIRPNRKLKRLDCLINDPLSAWFPIIKHNYCDLKTLVLTIKPIYQPSVLTWPSKLAPGKAMQYVNHVWDLTQQKTIQLIQAHFLLFFTDIHFVQRSTSKLFNNNNDSRLSPGISTHVSLCFTYINDENPKRNTPQEGYQFKDSLVNRLTYSQSSKPDRIHFSFSFNVVLVKGAACNELFQLMTLIEDPVSQHTTHLKLQRKIDHPNLFIDYIHLDFLLIHFPLLSEITISLYFTFLHDEYYVETVKEYRDLVEVSLLDTSRNYNRRLFTSLRVLNIDNIKIHQCIHHFLLTACPNLTRLNIKNCRINEQAVLCFDQLRTERGVEVHIDA